MSREMKDSGIAWIGDIPKEWEVCPIRRIMRNRSERNQPNAEVLSLYRDWGIVPKNSRDDNHNVTSEDTTNYKVVHKGDFVINKMKAWQGSMAVSDYDGIISPAYYVCYFTNDNVNKRYIHHLLRNESYKTEYMRLSSGLRVGQWDLNIENFLRIPMVLPSLPEQQKIADYLDKVCCEVDDLVALQETMIEELKAYKQSVITEAVTKGLNPDIPMKDSGIDWIGQIPKEWTLVPTKRLFSCKKQVVGNHADDYDRLALTMHGVIKRDKEDNEGLQPEKFDGYQILKKNEIVFKLIDLANVKTSRVGLSPYLGIVSPAYIIIRNNSKDNRYFYYWFMFMYHHNIFNQMGDDGVRSSLNADDVLKIPIANISLNEQQQIANYLDTKCSEIDSLIALKQAKIEELKEYKKSVIYEYVTGKKEVA